VGHPAAQTAAVAAAAARARDSHDKRQRALTALQTLETAGHTITFPAVAKAAAVSTWLVYTPGVREHIEAARQRQTAQAIAPTAITPPAAPAGLRADLALARQEIKQLRAERDKLHHRLRLQLGAEIRGPQHADLIARVAHLETANRQLLAERDARTAEAASAARRVQDLEDDLTAARESLRRMIRAENHRP
jgi:hypothetical protein